MKFRFVPVIFGLALTSASSAETSANAECNELSQGVGCELKWNFPNSRNKHYRVQVWSPTARSWEDLDGIKRYDGAGQRVGAVPAGHIYRVLACNGQACSSSNAVWAPVWSAPEYIPDTVTVEGPKGPITFQVTKTDHNGMPNPPRMVIAQYNMYLVHREALSFFQSDAEMPPMRAPRMKGEAPDTIEEVVAFNAQQDYEMIRSDVMTVRKGTQ